MLARTVGKDDGKIAAGDLVIIYERHDQMGFVYPKPGEILNSKWGAFYHDDIIGQQFGSKWYSRCSAGWLYILAPTPELWTLALQHRTQIVHTLDASIITARLALKPGSIVVESGTLMHTYNETSR